MYCMCRDVFAKYVSSPFVLIMNPLAAHGMLFLLHLPLSFVDYVNA